jgi:hypothetical protein
MSCRTSYCKKFLWIFAVLAVTVVVLRVTPATAQEIGSNVPFFCNGGTTGPPCTLFQLDGAESATANGNTCVGAFPTGPGANTLGSGGSSLPEFGCSSAEQDPVWPADWDALLSPTLIGSSSPLPIISTGTTGGSSGAGTISTPPYTFSTPWGSFGSFSGAIYSTLITSGISTILKSGSKNIGDISTWTVATQSSPPKDAYLAGAIVSYAAPPAAPVYGGHQLVYLGSTRFSPSGSATVGIWFFQENVSVCANGTQLCVDGTATVANHENKDLFLFLTFSGSGTATIQAAEWSCSTSTGNICSTPGSGSLGPASTLVTCPTLSDAGCAVTNALSSITLAKSTAAFQAPGELFNPMSVNPRIWPGFPNGVVPQLQFQETGVDFNQIFSGTAPCFSSVMFASVSSGSSPSQASLKSILLGSFNTCAISATKTCNAGTANLSNGTVTYPITGTIENTGTGSITDLTLTDRFNNASQAFDTGTPTCTCNSGCTITGSDCTTVSLIPGGTVTYNASITTSQNGGPDQVTATMGGTGGGSASATSPTATCLPLSFQSAVSITKKCDPGATLVAKNNVVEVEVDVSGNVTNNDLGSLPLSNVTVEDCVGGTFATIPAPTQTNPCPTVADNTCSGSLVTKVTTEPSSTITAGNSSAWSDTYFPSVAPACGPFNFSDQVLVTAQCTSKFCTCPTVQNIANTTCPLCPGPTCPPPTP